jgi:hypothetical protein
MLRPDERTAWTGFLAAAPDFGPIEEYAAHTRRNSYFRPVSPALDFFSIGNIAMNQVLDVQQMGVAIAKSARKLFISVGSTVLRRWGVHLSLAVENIGIADSAGNNQLADGATRSSMTGE